MNEKLKAFADFLGQNEEIKKALIEKVSQVNEDSQKKTEIVLAFAKEHGFELNADDLQQKSEELDDSDLDAITGGVVCVIVGTGDNYKCGLCFISGMGGAECVCVLGGGG